MATFNGIFQSIESESKTVSDTSVALPETPGQRVVVHLTVLADHVSAGGAYFDEGETCGGITRIPYSKAADTVDIACGKLVSIWQKAFLMHGADYLRHRRTTAICTRHQMLGSLVGRLRSSARNQLSAQPPCYYKEGFPLPSGWQTLLRRGLNLLAAQ